MKCISGRVFSFTKPENVKNERFSAKGGRFTFTQNSGNFGRIRSKDRLTTKFPTCWNGLKIEEVLFFKKISHALYSFVELLLFPLTRLLAWLRSSLVPGSPNKFGRRPVR